MDETPSTNVLEAPSHSPSSSPWAWCVASLVITTALSLAAAHAPPRIRLIGLFSVAFGLLIGWLLAVLAEKLVSHPSRLVMSLVAAILTLGGLIGCGWETFRLEQSRLAKSPNDDLALRLMEGMKAQGGAGDATPAKPSTLTAFRSHLSRRLRQLGDWPSPWPELFWLTELAAGASASVWALRRFHGVSSSSTDRTTVQA